MEQIYQRMNERETEDLIEIWQKHNREEWTEDAFEAVKAILIERLGKLPEQNPEDNEDKVKRDQENAWEYPSDKKLIKLADASEWLSTAIVGVTIIYLVLVLINNFSREGFRIGSMEGLLYVANVLINVFYAGFAFLILQAITEIIYFLIDLRELVTPSETEA